MPENSALERLSKRLNSKGVAEEEPRRSVLYPKGAPGPSDWQGAAPEPIVVPMATRKRTSPFTFLFFGSAAFFVVAVAVAAFLFFSGTNTVSTRNVDIKVSGPSQINAGSTLSLQVVITNRNPVPIELADLVVEFPQGTRSDADIAVAIPRTRVSLGTINPGESVNRTVKAVLFGQAGTQPAVHVSLEYHTPSSNAIYSADTTYTTRIGQSPASITVASESQVVSGQATSFVVTVTSNSPQTLSNMLLIATYPPGFTFTNSSPSPVSGPATWNLGDIEPGGTRTVTIKGVFTGEDGDERALTFTAGSELAGSNTDISAPLATAEADTTITKPFISASIALNDSIADQHTLVRGQGVSGQVFWTNNLPVAAQNLSITLSLNGAVLDRTSVRATQGFYSSSKSSIQWDKSTISDFAAVPPGQSGSLAFSFATLPLSQGTLQNPAINFTVTVHADRSSEGNVPGTVDSTTATKALVSTNLTLAASLSHSGNSGPVPPKADTETQYTVSWNLSNTANAVANTIVTATLPSYARFVSKASGDGVSYDDNQRTVTWNAGDLAARGSRSASFVIGVTPSVSQAGQMPVVVMNQKVTAFDRFVQENVSATAGDLTTASAATSQTQGLVVP